MLNNFFMRLKIFFAYLKYTCRNVRYNLNSFCLQSVTLYCYLNKSIEVYSINYSKVKYNIPIFNKRNISIA